MLLVPLLHPISAARPGWEAGGCSDQGCATSSHQHSGDEPSSHYAASPSLRANDCSSNYTLLQSSFLTEFSELGVVQGWMFFFFLPSFGCDGNCRLRSWQSPALPFDSKISFNQKMQRLDVLKHFSLSLFFFPLRTAILAVANKHTALSPRHDSLNKPAEPCLRIAAACVLPAPSRHHRASRLPAKGHFDP